MIAPVRRVIEAVTRLDGDMPLVVVGGDPAMGTPTVTIDQMEGSASPRDTCSTSAPHRPSRHWSTELGGTRPPHARLVRSVVPLSPHRGNAVAGDWGAGKGYQAGTLLARDTAVTAIFAANDRRRWA